MMVAQHILDREGTIMAYRWPEDTVFTRLALTVEEPWCRTCGGALTICDHRHHRVFTLKGPVHLVCKLAHCPARACPAHTQTLSPEAETTITMPWWGLGWDVVCWLATGVLPATGRYSSSALNWQIPTTFPCLMMRSNATSIAINRCWPPGIVIRSSW